MAKQWYVLPIVIVQVFCATFFVAQILASVLGLAPISWQFHELIELGAALGLLLGVLLGWMVARRASTADDADGRSGPDPLLGRPKRACAGCGCETIAGLQRCRRRLLCFGGALAFSCRSPFAGDVSIVDKSPRQ